MFNGKRFFFSHFPLGVAKDPSPLMRADAECVRDPPVTEEGGKTRMAVSIALFEIFGGVSAPDSFVAATEVLLNSVSGDCLSRAWSIMAIQRAIEVMFDLNSTVEMGGSCRTSF